MVEALTRNAAAVLPEGGLEEKLKLGRPLRVKLGIDVTAPQVTLGNGIPLQRMRAFQDAGHLGVLIVGDYTTRIGDPSGRSRERPIIDPAVIDANAQRYFDHACTIIDREKTEVRFNSEWLGKLDFAEILRLTRTTTVARLLEREDFAKRFAEKGLGATGRAHRQIPRQLGRDGHERLPRQLHRPRRGARGAVREDDADTR